MKTKELIKQLQEADPSGEEEVCVGNVSIVHVDSLPAYYDGPLQVIIYDEKGLIKSGKYKRSGKKIDIRTWSFSDIIWDYPNLEIDYSELGEFFGPRTKEAHDQIRKESNDLELKLDIGYFEKWAEKEAAKFIEDDKKDVKNSAGEFYRQNLKPTDPIPANISIYDSYVSRREKQWTEQLEVVFTHGEFNIQKREENGNPNS